MGTIDGEGAMARRYRRFWPDDEKRRIVDETRAPGISVSAVARRHRMNANLLFTWMRDPRFSAAKEAPQLLPVDISDAPVIEAEQSRPEISRGQVEVELPSGVRFRCDADIDPVHFARLVSALEHGS
jgi:transposase